MTILRCRCPVVAYAKTASRSRHFEAQPASAPSAHNLRETSKGRVFTGYAASGRSQTAASRPKRAPRAKLERLLGRSSGSRITLLTAPSRESNLSGVCGVRPRIQRRDRDGFKPSSLFSRSNTPQAPKSAGMVSPARGIATNAVRRAERPVEQRRVSLQLARFLAVKTGKRDAYPTFFNWLLGWFV